VGFQWDGLDIVGSSDGRGKKSGEGRGS
jgi:hypothetical protein